MVFKATENIYSILKKPLYFKTLSLIDLKVDSDSHGRGYLELTDRIHLAVMLFGVAHHGR